MWGVQFGVLKYLFLVYGSYLLSAFLLLVMVSMNILKYFLLLLQLLPSAASGAWTCQGASYEAALGSCPDGGSQKYSSGGNVTIYVKSARNLPNRDVFPMSSRLSDPYVQFVVGAGVERRSRTVRNSLDPVWDERVSLGLLGSATELLINVWDADSGVEYSDDLLHSHRMRVPFCSTFNASYVEIDCGEPFGCESHDSMWKMPNRKLCVESGSIDLTTGGECTLSSSTCLDIDIEIAPFDFTVEKFNEDAFTSMPTLSVFGDPTNDAPWSITNSFGRPFLDKVLRLDVDFPFSRDVSGALMMRLHSDDRYIGAVDDLYFYGALNFPAYVYVCRYTEDDADGVPPWMLNDLNAENVSITQLATDITGDVFECYYMTSGGTSKNKWGGVEDDSYVTFRSNTIPGHENGGPLFYNYQYIVLAIPAVISPPEEFVQITYNSGGFVKSFFQQGLILFWFAFIAFRFLARVQFKLERIPSLLVGLESSGPKKHVLSALFVGIYMESPCNVEFRAHLFHAQNLTYFFFLLPMLLFISWGFSIVSIVSPRSLGIGVAFLGISALLVFCALNTWRESKWRMSTSTLIMLTAAGLLFFAFIIACVFVDPGVVDYGRALDVTALSIVFGTLNCVPLILLSFRRDRSYQESMQRLVAKFASVIVSSKPRDERVDVSSSLVEKYLTVNKALHGLLGDKYTLNPNLPHLRHAGVLSDLKSSSSSSSNEVDRKLYKYAILVLFVYLMIAVARTDHPSLAFMNCLALMLLDFIHTSMSHGSETWSAGHHIFLLVSGRLLVTISTIETWILTYSVAFIVYSWFLISNVINNFLLMLTQEQAGQIVFLGEINKDRRNLDLAGTPQFSFALLLYSFSSLLLAYAFGRPEALPVSHVVVWGAQWPTYVFGLIACCAVIIIGLASACSRAFYLEKHGLLQNWSRDGYLFRKNIKLPIMLSVFLELAILSSGVLIYGATQSAAILTLSIFIPPIIVCFAYTYYSWVSNDYDFIVWPSRPDDLKKDPSDAPPTDIEVALGMVDNLFAKDDHLKQTSNLQKDIAMLDDDIFVLKEKHELKSLGNFELPSLRLPTVTSSSEEPIKMPPLPLKSVLRKKRENLETAGEFKKLELTHNNIRPSTPPDRDIFIDAADPWVVFDNADEFSLLDEQHVSKELTFVQSIESFFSIIITNVYRCSRSIFRVHAPVAPGFDEDVDQAENETRDPNPGVSTDNPPPNSDSQVVEVSDIPQRTAPPVAAPPVVKKKRGPWVKEGSLLHAFFTKKLPRRDYLTVGAGIMGMFLVMLMGCVLSGVVNPPWLGPTVWMAIWIFVCTAVPIIKYFHVYEVDFSMKCFACAAAFFHFMFCVCFFGAALQGDAGLVGSLWIFDFFIYYPFCVYLLFAVIRWVDNGCVLASTDSDFFDDDDVPWFKRISFYQYSLVLSLAVILVWQFYDWISVLVGKISLLLLLAVCVGHQFVHNWAENDFYLSEGYSFWGSVILKIILVVTALISLFSSSNPIFPISVFFVAFIFQNSTRLVMTMAALPPNTLVYLSPYVLPVYTYDARKGDIVDQTEASMYFLRALLGGALWGAFLAMFLYPVSVGVGIACLFLLAIATIVAWAISYVPLSIGRYSSLLTDDIIRSAASAAKDRVSERMKPFSVDIPGYVAQSDESMNNNDVDASDRGKRELKLSDLREDSAFASTIPITREQGSKSKPSSISTEKAKTSIELASELTYDTLALTHVRDDSHAFMHGEDATKERGFLGRFIDSCKAALGIRKARGWVRHNESSFTTTDCIAEAIITGRGPFGFLGVDGLLFGLLSRAKNQSSSSCLNQKWLEYYDENANRISASEMVEHFDSISVLKRLWDLELSIDETAEIEQRCGIQFLLLLILAGQSRLKKDQIMVQKFFRDNKFRLASNGINPPPEIFSSDSYASIDICLVAVWLTMLTPEEQNRFHLLKTSFAEEQRKRDENIDAEDNGIHAQTLSLAKSREKREKDVAAKIKREIRARQAERVKSFVEYLTPTEKLRFADVRAEWIKNADCKVASSDLDLYLRFRAAVMQYKDEATEYARHVLAEIESAQKDFKMGEYGRSYQFVDSEFPPSEFSLGPVSFASRVETWRCSLGISEHSCLFDEGTDPDDVEVGIFSTEWILSAVSMLAAAGGVGDGTVEEQILNLFTGHFSVDGDLTFQTEVGGYCIRLFSDGIWVPLILDDFFPVLKDGYWTNENRGMASAHSKECKEIWMSLIEKAFAKFYGSYASIENGYVHHALRMLTGCDSECILMANASRGPGRLDLWDKIVRYRANGYLLGAGTGTSSLVDRHVQNMGIIFNACYIIYDVRSIDGYCLLKLRNPPGSHEEWKGDWSDKSPLWTRRLKKKLGWTDADDNTFWMSFDDFCNIFRNLYVCRWYDKKKWKTTQISGVWKGSVPPKISDEAVAEGRGLSVKRPDDFDTSGGLPSKDNPRCVLENNPHYQLTILRPTDLCITLSQADTRGVTNEFLEPSALFLVKPKRLKDRKGLLPRLQYLDREEVIAYTGCPSKEVNQQIYISLLPGDYVLLAACYLAGMEGHFTLSIVANHKIKTSSIWPPQENSSGGGLSELYTESTVVHEFFKVDNARKLFSRVSEGIFGGPLKQEGSEPGNGGASDPAYEAFLDRLEQHAVEEGDAIDAASPSAEENV